MWIVCITSVRHVLTVNGYGGRQTKENEKSWCFKGWETLVNKIEFSNDFSQWIFFNPTYWKEVIGYLWLPNLDDFKVLLNDNNVSVWSYSYFIIGKIFIAFGIYQTISAFRKYGK